MWIFLWPLNISRLDFVEIWSFCLQICKFDLGYLSICHEQYFIRRRTIDQVDSAKLLGSDKLLVSGSSDTWSMVDPEVNKLVCSNLQLHNNSLSTCEGIKEKKKKSGQWDSLITFFSPRKQHEKSQYACKADLGKNINLIPYQSEGNWKIPVWKTHVVLCFSTINLVTIFYFGTHLLPL